MPSPTPNAPAKKAVLLLSGGLDSATVGAIARAEGYELHALTFRYGQRHEIEAEVARRVGAMLGVASQVDVAIDLRVFGGSALTADIAVPKDRDDAAMGDGIPITYVPARNTIFLSFALAQAEVLGARDIFIGVNAVDYSGYPDCRPEFIAAFQQMARLATRIGVEDARAETAALGAEARPGVGGELTIHAPLIHLTKAEIIQRGTALGVDYAQTLSCYDPTLAGLACGHCDACLLRRRGFEQAALPDPTRYA